MSTPVDANLKSRAMARFTTVFTHTFRIRVNAAEPTGHPTALRLLADCANICYISITAEIHGAV